MDSILQDLRYALRSLRRTPGFTATVIVVMALGIGVNSLIYTVVRGLVFRELPYDGVERMVTVESLDQKRGGESFEMSLPDLRDVAERSKTLQAVSAEVEVSTFVNTGEETQSFVATMASSELCKALGVRPQLGRWFTPEECRTGQNLASTVISDRIWRETLHADPHVLGRTLHMSGRERSVVGVMGPGFRFPENADFFVPFDLTDTTDSRGSHYLNAYARLAPGATRAQAQAELATIARSLAKDYPATNDHMTIVARDFRERLRSDVGAMVLMLSFAVTFVLLIACANVANLMLARGAARAREMGVRVALGATRARLVRQMLTESLLLSCTGGALGILLGSWGMRITLASIPVELPFWMHFELDPAVVAAVAGVSVLAGLAFGLAPALQASTDDVLTPLREGTPGGGDTAARRRMRNTLVVAEIALSVVLLIGSGLMIRSFLRLEQQSTALRTDGVLTGSVTMPMALYPDAASRERFVREFRGILAGLPGVHEVGAVLNLHLGRSRWSMSLQREGVDADDPHDSPTAMFNVITPGYLDAVGMRLLRGRDFNDGDVEGAPRVALVNAAAARELWPGKDPIGQRFRSGPRDPHGWATVVGVVATVRQHISRQDRSLAEVLVAHAQYGSQSMQYAIRAASPPAVIAAAVRKALRERDPNLAFAGARTLREHVERAAWQTRVYAQLMGAFAVIALIIAALGIYGVMAYTVTQRTREIGIRMALGAAREDVQRLVLGHAIQLTLLGSGLGLALAYGLTRFMQSLLFGVRPDDPPTFVGVTLILALSSAAAAWLPTARAVRVDPIVALRHE